MVRNVDCGVLQCESRLLAVSTRREFPVSNVCYFVRQTMIVIVKYGINSRFRHNIARFEDCHFGFPRFRFPSNGNLSRIRRERSGSETKWCPNATASTVPANTAPSALSGSNPQAEISCPLKMGLSHSAAIAPRLASTTSPPAIRGSINLRHLFSVGRSAAKQPGSDQHSAQKRVSDDSDRRTRKKPRPR